MKKNQVKHFSISAAIIVGLTLLDQWVKILAVNHLKAGPRYNFFGDLIHIEYAENRGAFLSLGATMSDEARLWIFVFGVVAILAFCFYSMVKSIEHLPSVIAFSLVISGGIGNLVDRVAQGYVVDYIHMGFGNWLRTGVFNVADVAISGGLIYLLVMQYKSPAKAKADA